ncbi:unnamed protein product [Musa textilis]
MASPAKSGSRGASACHLPTSFSGLLKSPPPYIFVACGVQSLIWERQPPTMDVTCPTRHFNLSDVLYGTRSDEAGQRGIHEDIEVCYTNIDEKINLVNFYRIIRPTIPLMINQIR